MDKIKEIKDLIYEKLNDVSSLEQLNNLKVEFLGKKGLITEANAKIKDIEVDKKKEYGMLVNELKSLFQEKYDENKKRLEDEIIKAKLEKDVIDVTLPGSIINIGSKSPIERIIDEVEDIMISMGYDVLDGPEIEQDLYNFELLNLPKGHPARDAQDTFYIKDEELLLRSQTSPVQIRAMLADKEKKGIRMICPGKTYRRDDDDATHSHQFTQIEGLIVDKNISLSDLKGTLDVIAKKLFNENVETRFRPSYYPFTEPSVEFDITCFNCHKKGCNICKNTGYITVGGAGLVHYKVLENCGYDSNLYSGFAFGFGADRLAMLKYGIKDIRTFYTPHDLRTIKQFAKKEGI